MTDNFNENLPNSKPLVTVVMPVYNTAEALLKEAIGSVLCQTMQDFELFIVDDNSAEYVGRVVKTYISHLNFCVFS